MNLGTVSLSIYFDSLTKMAGYSWSRARDTMFIKTDTECGSRYPVWSDEKKPAARIKRVVSRRWGYIEKKGAREQRSKSTKFGLAPRSSIRARAEELFRIPTELAE